MRARQQSLVIAVSLAVACGGSGGSPARMKEKADPDASRPAAKRDAGVPELDATPPEVSAHAGDWPLPNHDYDNTRASFTTKIDASNVSTLHERWRFAIPPVSGSPFGSFSASVLILGDDVYAQDMASNVYALSAKSGKKRWDKSLALTTVGPNGVAVGWGKLFACSDHGLLALDLEHGDELWHFEPRLHGSEGVDIQPTVYGGMVLMSTVPANLQSGYAGNSRGIVYALDHEHGKALWSFDTVDSKDIWGDAENNGGGGAWYPPLVDVERDRVYFGTGNPTPFPGTTDAPNGSSRPGPNLYSSSLIALDRVHGELAWFHQERAHDLFDWDFQNAPMRIEVSIDGRMRELIIGSGKTGTVVALDPESGKLVWRAKVGRHENDDLDEIPAGKTVTVFPGALGGVISATAYADSAIYVPVVDMAAAFSGDGFTPDLGNGKGELVALDARDGSLLWKHALPAPCYGAATVVNDLVLTSDANGRVYALSRSDGSEVWTYDAPAGINAPLSVAGDLLLVPAGIGKDQALVALSL